MGSCKEDQSEIGKQLLEMNRIIPKMKEGNKMIRGED